MAEREGILRPALGGFLAAALAVLAFGVWTRARAPGFEEALGILTDGDPDRAERLRATRVVLERGLTRSDRRGLVLAAMAAVALNDRDAWAAATRALGPPAPERLPPEPGGIAEASLGEPALEQLLRAMAAEEAGRRDAARGLYGRAAAAADLWDMPLAADLARSGLARVR